VHWSTILVLTLAWNGLFLLDQRLAPTNLLVQLLLSPLFLVFCLSWGTRVSPRLQKMVLREGRSVTEIKHSLQFLQMISGLLLTIFTVLFLAGVFPN
jgi:predicted PurR-regulated permease PerM